MKIGMIGLGRIQGKLLPINSLLPSTGVPRFTCLAPALPCTDESCSWVLGGPSGVSVWPALAGNADDCA